MIQQNRSEFESDTALVTEKQLRSRVHVHGRQQDVSALSKFAVWLITANGYAPGTVEALIYRDRFSRSWTGLQKNPVYQANKHRVQLCLTSKYSEAAILFKLPLLSQAWFIISQIAAAPPPKCVNLTLEHPVQWQNAPFCHVHGTETSFGEQCPTITTASRATFIYGPAFHG